MESMETLTINGSYGEGGGQVLRNSLALSMITGRGIRVLNIRANRKNPGLRPQHLAAVRGAAEISLARVEGDEIDSHGVLFIPGKITGGEYTFDIGTAGSVTLLLQCLLPPLLKAENESHLTLRGGTDVPWSPPVDYLRFVLFPLLRSMGADTDLTLVRRGYYPEGGGEIKVTVRPSELSGMECVGDVEQSIGIGGRVFLTNLPDHISDRMMQAAERELKGKLGMDVPIRIERSDEIGHSIGTGITLWATKDDDGMDQGGTGGEDDQMGIGSILGSSVLGKRGLKAEDVGAQAAQDLIQEVEGRCGVDIHMGDQLPVFAPLIESGAVHGDHLVPGSRMHYSVREITPHQRTALWVLEQFGHSTSTVYRDGFHVFL